jgi:hypothetical protein
MNAKTIAKLVNLLVDHDIEEKRLISLAKKQNCLPSDLPPEEKEVHDRLEWSTLDQFFVATTEEGRLAIDIYDHLHDFIELY